MSNDAFELPEPNPGETTPYALVGQARALPGRADALEAELLALVAPTRSEPGMMQYHVHRDRADPDLFVFYEAWRSLGDLRRHLSTPHVSRFLARRSEFIAGEMAVNWLRMASAHPA